MRLHLGYVPLTDAAPLIVAAEEGFAAAEDLTIELSREPSWATLRDKLALGHLDGAHLLAPLAIAMAEGLSGAQAPLVVPYVMNLNGNALTVSTALWAEMAGEGACDGDLTATARAFGAAARRRPADRPLKVATVFPFSTHSIQLRLFAEAAGLRLHEDLYLTVVPPPAMARTLDHGAIDAFCVGSPWNGVAVDAGAGRIAAFGVDIAPDAPEKVLALPAGRTGPAAALVRALRAAGTWCADPANRERLAALLAAPRHLDLDPAPILRSLAGDLTVAPDGTRRAHPRYITFGDGRPSPEQERWLREAMEPAAPRLPGAAPLFRPDLYDAAVAGAP